MTDAQRQAVVTCLVQMARADGKVVAEEQRVLKKLLKQLGSAGQELSSLPARSDIPHLEEVLVSEAERHQVIKQLMTLSMCDGNISFTEFAYLATIAERLQVSSQDMERLRDEVLASV